MNAIKARIIRALLWSQKYAKADMLYIARSGSWVAFGQAMNSIFSLVLIIAFANLLPKESFGTYKYILSILGVLNIFTLTGMNNAVARTVAKGNEGVLIPAVRYQLVWNLMMSVALLGLALYYHLHDNTLFALSFLILGLFVPFTLAFNTYGSYLEGRKKFGEANILNVLSTLTYSIGLLVALFVTDEIPWLIATYAITTFVPSVISYSYILRKYSPPITEDARDTLTYGRELTYIRFIDPVVSQIDKIILGHFWGPTQLALYALATAIPNRATLFIKSWVAIGFPKFSEKTTGEINSVFFRRILQGMSVGALITLAYILVAPTIFMYLLPQYLESIFYSQILAVNFIFALPNRYVSLLFGSQGFSKPLFHRTLMISSINIVLYVSFGVYGGVVGLVCASVISSCIGLLLNILLWKKITATVVSS